MPKSKYDKGERLLREPCATLVSEGRCARWRRDGGRTMRGGETRKAEALTLYAVERDATDKPTDDELIEIARRIEADTLDGRCHMRITEPGRACRLHGGNARHGVDSPLFIHGGRMKIRRLTREEVELYESMLADPLRFAYDPQLAMLAVLLDDALSRRNSGVTTERLKSLKLSMKEFWAATRTGKAVEIGRAAKTLDSLISKVASEYGDNEDARREALTLLKEMRQTQAAEHIRRHRESVLISVDERRAQDARMVEISWQRMEKEIKAAKTNEEVESLRTAFVHFAEDLIAEGKRWDKEIGLSVN